MSASGPDEDVEAGQDVLGEALPRRVRDLEPDDVLRVLAQPFEDSRSDRVPGGRRELVDVERQRRAGQRGGQEVRMLRALVELEVRRPDDDDRVGADLGRVRSEGDGVGGRLRPAVDGDAKPSIGRLQEEIGHVSTLLDPQQDPLARRAERKDAVEPRSDEEVGQRLERCLVDLGSVLAQRRHRCRERTPEQRHQR